MYRTRLAYSLLGLLFVASLFLSLPIRADVGVNPTSLSFGSVTVNTTSSAATVVVTNSGRRTFSILQVSSSLPEFIVISPALPMTLGPHGSASFQVMFHPDAAVTFNGSIVLRTSHSGDGNHKISLSGTGITAPSAASQSAFLSATPSALNFGNTLVGNSASMMVSLTNTGTESVNVSQVAITGTGFTVSGFPGVVTLAAGQNLTLTVSFAPGPVGTATGSLSVVSSATNSSVAISLTGTGVQPQLAANPSGASFGIVVVGSSNSQTINLTNSGTAPVSISQANVSGAGFSITGISGMPLTIKAGTSATFNAVFAPSANGSVTGSVSLLSNAPSSPLTISLSGTGVAATYLLSANPTSLSFNNVNDGSSSSLPVTLTNAGNSNVTITNATASGAGFSTSGVSGMTLTPNQTASLNVTFAPTVTGAVSGSVAVASTATNSPMIAVSGAGVQQVSHLVDLSWTASVSTEVVGYNVYRGTVSGGPYGILNSAPVAADTYTDSTVQSGQEYFYTVRSVDGSGTESANSTEVSATIQ